MRGLHTWDELKAEELVDDRRHERIFPKVDDIVHHLRVALVGQRQISQIGTHVWDARAVLLPCK